MTTTAPFEFKRFKPFDYDNYFLRPLSENDIELYKQTNTKPDFNKLMKLEKKKLEYNERLYQYSLIYEKYRVELDLIRRQRIFNREYITKLSTDTTTYSFIEGYNNKTFKKNLEQIINIKERENNAYYDLYTKICRKFNKIKREFKRNYAEIYMEIQLFDNSTIQKIGVNEEAQLLKRVDKLPDELIRVVQTYLTFETRVTILEHKAKNTLNKELDSYAIHMIPCRIYRNYYRKMDLYPELKALFKKFGTIFYYTSDDYYAMGEVYVSRYVRAKNIKQVRLFTSYLLLLLDQHNRFNWLYEIYRLILIGKNKLCRDYNTLI